MLYLFWCWQYDWHYIIVCWPPTCMTSVLYLFCCIYLCVRLQECTAGTYTNHTGASTCDTCPDGFYCLPVQPDNATLNAQPCPEGYYCPAGTVCNDKVVCLPVQISLCELKDSFQNNSIFNFFQKPSFNYKISICSKFVNLISMSPYWVTCISNVLCCPIPVINSMDDWFQVQE